MRYRVYPSNLSSAKLLWYPDPEDRIFRRVISVVLGETSLTISYFIETVSLIDSEIVSVVSLSTTEITEITRLKNRSSRSDTLIWTFGNFVAPLFLPEDKTFTRPHLPI